MPAQQVSPISQVEPPAASAQPLATQRPARHPIIEAGVRPDVDRAAGIEQRRHASTWRVSLSLTAGAAAVEWRARPGVIGWTNAPARLRRLPGFEERVFAEFDCRDEICELAREGRECDGPFDVDLGEVSVLPLDEHDPVAVDAARWGVGDPSSLVVTSSRRSLSRSQ